MEPISATPSRSSIVSVPHTDITVPAAPAVNGNGNGNGHVSASTTSVSVSAAASKEHIHAPILNNTPSHSKISTSKLKKTAYPVIREYEFGSSIRSRTLQMSEFKDMGPVDLVHISNIHHSSKVKETGQYHFINGLDVSSIDAPIAYLSSVLLNLEIESKRSKKDLKIGTFCSWNCFSKGDLRIRAEFPGNITTSFVFADPTKVPLSGDKITENMWLETHATAIIRSMLFNQNLTRILPGMVKLNPLQSKKLSMGLIDKLCSLLPRGYLAGCRSTVLTPTLQNNYLADALLKIVELTDLFDYTIDRIKQLPGNERFELLVIKILFLADREVEGVRLLHEAILRNPRDAMLLLEQSNYLISKERADLALTAAHKALNAMPTEFEIWENLVQVQIMLGKYKEALSTLNSAPMYSSKKRDTALIDAKDEIEFEPPFEGCIEEIWDESELVYGYQTPLTLASLAEIDACDPVLIKIFNNSRLYGTFARSYNLISNMVRIIGWDKILSIRSKIFVMEDEMVGQDFSTLRNKTLCERWLDHLFLILYDDLRVVMIWENERIDNVIRHSALEWLLIGLASIRCHHYESGIAALKTTINNKFNFFASLELINVSKESGTKKFKMLHNRTIYNSDVINTKLMNDEFIIKLIIKHMSYEKRYYGEFNPELFLAIRDFIKFTYNEIYLKSLIAGEFNKNTRLFMLTDRVIDWISGYID